jgi:hypothetical protein
MSAKAYKLRPEFEDTFVGGSVITGATCQSMDLRYEIDKAGQIITSDAVFQSILENYYGQRDGKNIRIFQAFEINPETGDHLAFALEGDPEHMTPAVQPPRPDLAARAPKPVVNEAPIINPDAVSASEEPEVQSGEAQGAAGPEMAAGEPVVTLDVAPVATVDHESDGYGGLSMSELTDLVRERGLKAPYKASDAQLIAILEANDEQEAGS